MNASVSIETITPALASAWLENRFEGQRNVRDPHVQRLAATIANGGWKLTCDAVTLIKGKLGNGQHRCEAIVLANKPCEALVLRTMDESLFDVMDSGVTRSVADVLAQHNVGSATIISAAARAALAFERGMMTRISTSKGRNQNGTAIKDILTRQDVIAYCNENQDKLAKFAQIVGKLYNETGILQPSLGTAFLQVAHKRGEGRAIDFITTIYTGDTVDAAFDIRERLIKNKLSKSKLPTAYIFGLMIKAFKSYLKNERPQIYKIAANEDYPTL